jgi:hypothetical protein
MEFEISANDLRSPERCAELHEMIDALKGYARKELRRRERGFLDSVEAQLATHGFLTRGQREMLEKLHAEHLG